MANTFPKSEKLCGKLRISALYAEGKRLTAFPMRVTFVCLPENATSEAVPNQEPNANVPSPHATNPTLLPHREPEVLIWAPKSLFKHAVDRNRMRRLMREAYRLQAQPLRAYCREHACTMHIAFNYIDKQMRSQDELCHAMDKAIRKMIAACEKE